MLARAHLIHHKRSAYYDALETSNKDTEISGWLDYFSGVVLEALGATQTLIEFLIAKTRFYDRVRGSLNERQERAIERMFREGPEGFKGGLSAGNYITNTGAARATATRDLHDLVEKGIFIATGALKSTRYHLALNEPDAGRPKASRLKLLERQDRPNRLKSSASDRGSMMDNPDRRNLTGGASPCTLARL